MSSTNVQKKLRFGRGPQRYDSFAVFTTANTSAPTIVEQEGCSVTRSNVGEFTIACQDPTKGTVKYWIGTQIEGTTSAQTVIVSSNSPSTKTVKLLVVGAGGSTAADTTGLTIHVEISARVAT